MELPLITHIVLMKFADPANRDEAKKRLEALPAGIPQIKTLTVGLDVVGSEVSQDLALITTHESVDDAQGLPGAPGARGVRRLAASAAHVARRRRLRVLIPPVRLIQPV